MLKPRLLRPGDTVAAISLSWGGPGTFPYRYEQGKRQLRETFGVEVVETPHALRDPAWIAAHPEARAADLMAAFADPSISGIISTIGGDDSIRILPWLDLEVIRANPKIFLGYSDTTVTHLACFKAGLVSFYGPSIMAGFAENGGLFPYLETSLRRTIFSAEPPGIIEPNSDGWTAEFLDWEIETPNPQRRTLNPATGWRFLQGTGRVQGHLLGGCLEVLDWLRGTPVWPDRGQWQGAILFIETSEEAPPPVTVGRILRTFGAMGILEGLAGIIVGRPGINIPPEDQHLYDARSLAARTDGYDEAILQVVAREQGLTHLPIITNMDFGHTDPMFVLPYGVMGEIDCDGRSFAIVESGVVEGDTA
jgi:muramoyltetrapeptide carboxypeptidase LdcA involved in peptidoglycan recycling